MLTKNQTLTAEVQDITNLGAGLARKDGSVIFIDGAVPGDTVRVKLIKVTKTYAIGRLEEILSPSPDRVDPGCPSAKNCGGCAYRFISRENEAKRKRDYVISAFRKAGMPGAEVEELLQPTGESGYRNKVMYPVGEDGEIGYYARHTHRIIPCQSCPLQAEEFSPILSEIRDFLREYQIKGVRHLYLRIGKGTGQIMVALVTEKPTLSHSDELVRRLIGKFPEVRSILLNVNPDDTNVILGKECVLLYGDGTIEDILCGLRFRISPLSFYQVNHDAAEALYAQALKRAKTTNPKTLADLYCGTGTIGLYFASQMKGMKLSGIEIVPDAVKNAKYNAEHNGIENAEFRCADSVAAEIGGFDCVVVDPPRKGCSQEVLEKIREAATPHLVYISCNVDTLARDAAFLEKNGYRMGKVTPVDLFPRTGSIECVTDFIRI